MFGYLNRCRNSLTKHYRRTVAARALAALDDHQLKDIGINRGQIWAATGEHDARRDPSLAA